MNDIENKLEWRGYSSFYKLENKLGPVLNINEKEIEKFGCSVDAVEVAIDKFSSMIRRDILISEYIEKSNVTNILDIGGDIGGLGVRIIDKGLSVTVCEPNTECKNIIEKNSMNYIPYSVEDICNKKLNLNLYDCICCLNFTHVKWGDENLKNKFFDILNNSNSKILFVSIIGKLPKAFNNYSENKEFNKYTFSFSWLKKLQSLIGRISRGRYTNRYLNHLLRIDEYTSMQRMLVRNK